MRLAFLLTLAALQVVQLSSAQVRRGEIENTSIDFIKSKQIVLPQYDKESTTNYQSLKFDSLPVAAPRLEQTLFRSANKVDIKPKLSLFEDKNNVAPTKQNYVRAGIGNYLTLSLEGLYGANMGDAQVTGHIRHLSSTLGADRYGSLGKTDVDLIYNRALNPKTILTLTPRINLYRYNFFGRNHDLIDGKNTVRQNIYRGGMDFSLTSNAKKSPFSVSGGLSRVSTTVGAAENLLRLDGRVTGITLAKDLALELSNTFSFSNLGQKKSTIRLFDVLAPSVVYKKDKVSLSATVGVGLENDTIDKAAFHLLPYVSGRYTIDSSIYLSIGAGSTMRQLYLNDLLFQNPWLGRSNSLAYQLSRFGVQAELGGSFGGVDLTLQPSFETIKNYSIFTQEPLSQDTSQFAATQIKDGLNLFSVRLQGGYGLSKTLRLGASVTYQNIEDLNGFKIPYFSNFLFKTSLAIRATDQLTITPAFLLNSEQTGYTSRGQAVKLGVVHDLQLGVQYAVSERISAFLDVYNIANNRAYIYTNYRYRGVMGIIGLRLNF